MNARVTNFILVYFCEKSFRVREIKIENPMSQWSVAVRQLDATVFAGLL